MIRLNIIISKNNINKKLFQKYSHIINLYFIYIVVEIN